MGEAKLPPPLKKGKVIQFPAPSGSGAASPRGPLAALVEKRPPTRATAAAMANNKSLTYCDVCLETADASNRQTTAGNTNTLDDGDDGIISEFLSLINAARTHTPSSVVEAMPPGGRMPPVGNGGDAVSRSPCSRWGVRRDRKKASEGVVLELQEEIIQEFLGVGFRNDGTKENKVKESERIGIFGGESLISTKSQLFAAGKRYNNEGDKSGQMIPQHFNSPSQPVIFETTYLEPREALEGTLNSHSVYSPCERDTPEGPSPVSTLRREAGAPYRCQWVRRHTMPSGVHPSTPTSVGGRGDRLPGTTRFAGRHRLTSGNRIYDTI